MWMKLVFPPPPPIPHPSHFFHDLDLIILIINVDETCLASSSSSSSLLSSSLSQYSPLCFRRRRASKPKAESQFSDTETRRYSCSPSYGRCVDEERRQWRRQRFPRRRDAFASASDGDDVNNGDGRSRDYEGSRCLAANINQGKDQRESRRERWGSSSGL